MQFLDSQRMSPKSQLKRLGFRLARLDGASKPTYSQGTHRAIRIKVGNGGKLISSGDSKSLPFSYPLTEVPLQRTPIAPDLLQRATRMDFDNYLAGAILVKVDRAGMLSSLELRSPLLDYRLIEFAFRKSCHRI